MPEAKEDAEEADLSLLFTQDEGDARWRLNFYIQPRLEPNVHAWLVDAIKHSGGRIANEHREAFPRRGYILVDPTSRRGRNLILSRPSDPSESIWVVSWTFITGCLEAKKLLDPEGFARTSPIFLEPGYGRLIKAFIHRSIPKETRSNLSTRIANHGGIIVDNKKDARVIICLPTSPKLLELRKLYPNSSEKAIESPLWVGECLKAGEIEFTQRRGGREPRALFSYEDDLRLVKYLAEVCPKPKPYVNSRGAPKLYEHLVKNPKAYPWAVGHPAASWRERYKTKPAYMDELIEKHLRSKTGRDRPRLTADPGNSSGSGAQRKAKSEPVPSRKRKAPTSDSDEEAGGRQRKIPRPPSLSPDDLLPKRGSSVIDGVGTIDADEPGKNTAAEEGHVDENRPSLPPEPSHNVPEEDTQPHSGPEEVDEEDDLTFESGPATQAMVAEHQALSRYITRSVSRAFSRAPSHAPSAGVLGLRAPKTNHLDMEPVSEAIEAGEGDDSADNTQEVEAILSGQKTQATLDIPPSSELELHPESAGSSVSWSGDMVHSRNDEGDPAEGEQLFEEDMYSEERVLDGDDHREPTPRPNLSAGLDAGLSPQDYLSTSSSPIRTHDPRAGSSNAYITSAPVERLPENVDSTSATANRTRRPRESSFQIIPVHPERVPARVRSPDPIPMFADLDPAIARALGKMCKKFSFTPEEVLKKWEINQGHLMATYEVLEKNRRFLDQADLYMMDD